MFFNLNESNRIDLLSLGFGVFGKQDKNSINNAIEDLALEDTESQQVKDIMGITEFGRKAKSFDITVSSVVVAFCFSSFSVFGIISL